ncbi:hypothetical protein [Streptantibioticus ferralitis]|uniref:Lipoprotein n=1 Tax=Streptantibioticus ferralitis TaxID=236510 RepID=A0ABT5Z1M5_9ACTN|nr:hypothetical protein [Streptantibioticus ferralitis]MDF2257668.1 hypothetical protein [Streptantibioticus ferralitis]
MTLLAALSLGAAGCTGEAPSPARDNGGAPPAPAPASSSQPVAGVEDAVAAYRAMWKDLEAAGRTADPNAPQLGDHAAGGALRLLKYGLAKDRQDGVIAKGEVILSPQVESATPAAAPKQVKIVDCSDGSHWLVYKHDGALENDVPGGHHETKATVQHFGTEWKVVDLTMGEVGSC